MPIGWRRSEKKMQWELIRDDWRVSHEQVIAFVTDEFLADTALPAEGVQRHVTQRFGVPLPAEAFQKPILITSEPS